MSPTTTSTSTTPLTTVMMLCFIQSASAQWGSALCPLTFADVGVDEDVFRPPVVTMSLPNALDTVDCSATNLSTAHDDDDVGPDEDVFALAKSQSPFPNELGEFAVDADWTLGAAIEQNDVPALFMQYKALADLRTAPGCQHGVVRQPAAHRSGGNFTLFYTNKDSCDGGNVLGLVVDRLGPVRMIRDSSMEHFSGEEAELTADARLEEEGRMIEAELRERKRELRVLDAELRALAEDMRTCYTC